MAVWAKPIVPIGSWAVAILNRARTGGPRGFSVTMAGLKLANVSVDVIKYYTVLDILSKRSLGSRSSIQPISVLVNPSGVCLLRIVPADCRTNGEEAN